MTVTATNAVSPRCFSQLLIGQGYHDAVYKGEDALLMTLSIDKYTNNTTPATPFNLYAVEGTKGLCIDLRSEIVNVPLAFYNSNLPFAPVTYLWFTGVNNIDGELVLYDALTDTERRIQDGIYLEIETPEANHQTRYFIRRPGFDPAHPDDEQPIATGVENAINNPSHVIKLLKDNQVLIIRDGHVYTVVGQQIR